ncbi:MAG TPA: heat-inducible transcriptional repressor HrcA [Polyangiaceae bacterium]|nr:heat-inducible transcriptional repressor HrcA [Polyangiaceae bacterium]
MTSLPKRARSVLYAAVTEFIASGEPVASRTLTKKYGFELSAATIRNVLADLEESGYLTQPHTSAGRVPTEAAYRLFVDALMEERSLSHEERADIDGWFSELPPGTDLLREAGRRLSQMSGAPALLVRASSATRTLLKLRFIATRPGELLAVIVFSDGTVENRFFSLTEPLSDQELERIHNMLEEAVAGRTLVGVREHFVSGMREQTGELSTLHEKGLSLVRAAADGAARGLSIEIEGQARLLERPEFGDVESARELLRVLEDRQRLLALLDSALASDNVRVFLGEEAAQAVGCPVSVVAAPFREDDGESAGALGIIGPTRMDFPFVVPRVSAAAEAMSAALAKLQNTKPRE